MSTKKKSIKKLSEVEAQWISVKEETPFTGEFVLVYIANAVPGYTDLNNASCITAARYLENDQDSEISDLVSWGNDAGGTLNDQFEEGQVTHWMSLPSKPIHRCPHCSGVLED